MKLFYIASVAHTRRDSAHILWWGHDDRGYTPVVGRAGVYTLERVRAHLGYYHRGDDTIAIPIAAAASLSVDPGRDKWGNPFYDQIGPVVPNTRESWEILLASALADPAPAYTPRPNWLGRPPQRAKRT